MSCIQSVVTYTIFTRIMACETAKEACDKLKEEFQDQTNASNKSEKGV